jgi:hypothetical protein
MVVLNFVEFVEEIMSLIYDIVAYIQLEVLVHKYVHVNM